VVDQTPPVVWSINATITGLLTNTPAANILLRHRPDETQTSLAGGQARDDGGRKWVEPVAGRSFQV